jgi:hypothetical protein
LTGREPLIATDVAGIAGLVVLAGVEDEAL